MAGGKKRGSSRGRKPGNGQSVKVRDAVAATDAPAIVASPERVSGEAPEPKAGGTSPIKFGGVLITVFIVSLLLGFLHGKRASPKYKDADAAGHIEAYVTKYSSVEFPQWKIERFPDGRLHTMELQDGVITFKCGFEPYHQSVKDGKVLSPAQYEEVVKSNTPKREKSESSGVTPDLFGRDALWTISPELLATHEADLPSREVQEMGTPHEGVSMNEVIGIMLGGAEIYTVRYAANQVGGYWKEMKGTSRLKRFGRAVQLIGAGISGFATGFYMGYDDAPDCDSEAFKGQLKSQELWDHVGQNLKASYGLKFNRDLKTGIVSMIDTYHGIPISLRDSWLAVNSVIHSKALGVASTDFVVADSVRDKLAFTTAERDPMKFLPMWASMASMAATFLSRAYDDSKFNRQLMRAVIENQLWVKNDRASWKPREDHDFEELIEGYFRTDIAEGYKLPPEKLKKLLGP